MKIELGKTYKTRDGLKARVICVDRKFDDPVVALFFMGDYESIGTFRADGRYCSEESGTDLIEEWREPLTVWATTSDYGTVHTCTSERSARACAAATGQRWRVVKLVEVSE